MSAGGSKSASRPEKAHFTVKGHNFLVHKRYVLGKALGAGAYGVVCSVKDNSAGSGEDNKYAMKKIGRLFDDLTDAKRILREIRLIKSMDHPNVLKIVDIDEPENYGKFNEIYLVFELMDTDLSKLIRSRHKLQESQLRYFAYQMLRGLKYIHRYVCHLEYLDAFAHIHSYGAQNLTLIAAVLIPRAQSIFRLANAFTALACIFFFPVPTFCIAT